MVTTYVSSGPASTNRLGPLRIVIHLIVVALCGVVAWKFGGFVLVLVGGFLAALVRLPVFFYKAFLVPVLRGVQCPTCGVWGLERVACVSFGDRFYRCGSCGQRCKRTDYDAPWYDASGRDDDDMYKPVPVYGPARRREAFANGLKGLGVFAAFLSSCAAPALIGGHWGAVVAATSLSLVLFSVCRVSRKNTLPTHPPLWDREVDP